MPPAVTPTSMFARLGLGAVLVGGRALVLGAERWGVLAATPVTERAGRHALIGLAVVAPSVVTRGLRGIRGRLEGPLRRVVTLLPAPVGVRWGRLRRDLSNTLARLADLGALEEARALRTVEGASASVLAEALGRISAAEGMRELVVEQSRSMEAQLLDRFRGRFTAADRALERLIGKDGRDS